MTSEITGTRDAGVDRDATSSPRGTGDPTPSPTASPLATTGDERVIGVVPVASPAASEAEAQERYVEARDAWTAAMRAANSGRPADLAALAIAQGAYEAAAAELDAWESGERLAIPVGSQKDATVGAIVNQELAWRQVQAPRKESGLLGRLSRRFRKG